MYSLIKTEGLYLVTQPHWATTKSEQCNLYSGQPRAQLKNGVPITKEKKGIGIREQQEISIT